jgi:pimeloyl-ACP methyl ester carboxylesterase
MANDLHTAIKHSTLAIIKAGRHLTPLEKPDEIAAQLKALAERTGR